jgi:hypothetical protein
MDRGYSILSTGEKAYANRVLREVAEGEIVFPRDVNRFIWFATLWYQHNGRKLWADQMYAKNWARRFGNKTEYRHSDNQRLSFLVKVDGMKSAIARYARQSLDYYPMRSPNYKLNREAKEMAAIILADALKKAK